MKTCCLIFLWIPLFAWVGPAWTATLPTWYLNPPSSDEQFLYGVGEGANFQEAKHMALSAVAEEISVAISSKVEKRESLTTVNNDSIYGKQFSQKVTAEVSKVKFSKIEVLKNEIQGGKAFVLVSVDRQALEAQEKGEIERSLADLEAMYVSSLKDPVYRRFTKLKKIVEEKEKVVSKLNIIQGLNDSYDPTPVYAKMLQYSDDLRHIQDNLSIYVQPEKGNLIVKDILESALSADSVKVSASSRAKDPNLLIIKYSIDLRREEIYGAKMVKMTVHLKLYSSTGELVASSQIECNGSSMDGFERATEAASQSFGKKVKEVGIVKMLGLG